MDGQIEVVAAPSAPVPSSGSVCTAGSVFGAAGSCARLAHVFHGDDDLQVELLAGAGVDEPDRPTARDEAADLLERPLRRGQPDALDGLADEPVEPLDREREVRAPFGACNRMHLVEDQRRTSRSMSRPCEVRSRNSDSGVVIRMSGGLRSIAARSFCGVSPVRTATVSSDWRPANGPRRLRSTS